MSISLILQTLLSTAAVMATVLLILFVVTGIGLLTSFSWQQGVGVRIRSAIWLGWFWVAVYVSTAHLFFAMKPPVAVPLIIAGLTGWFLLIRKSGFPKLKLRGQPWWIYGAWAALFALFVLLSNQTLRAPTSSADSGYYRIPYSTWAEMEPLTFGLANLNVWLGYGQFTDTLGSFISPQTFRFLTLAFLSSLLVELLARLTELRPNACNRRSTFGFSYFFLCLVALELSTPWANIWISTPTVDVVAPVLILVGIGYLFDWTASTEDHITNRGALVVFLSATATAAALRPNVALLLAIFVTLMVVTTFFPSRRWGSPFRPSGLSLSLLATGLGLLVLGSTVMLGNALRTGFPFFPVSSWGEVPSDWSIGSSKLQQVQEVNYASAKTWISNLPYGETPWDFGSVARASAAEPGFQLLIVACIVSFITLATMLTHRTSKQEPSLSTLAAVLGALIAVTLISLLVAPNPRYVTGFVVAISATLIAYSVMLAMPQRKLRNFLVTFVGIGVSIVFLQKGYLGSALLNPVIADGSGPFGAHSPPEAVTETFVTNSGLEIKYAPNWLCWATEPPCTFVPNANLELRGETLREGFRIRQ